MLNKLTILSAALLMSSVASAGYSDYQLCNEYGSEYTNGSSGERYTPSFVTNTSAWLGQYIITNVSNETVKVKLEFTDWQGAAYTPTSVTYGTPSNFTATNTPLNLINGGELLPGQLGIVTINDNNNSVVNVGKLSWTSEGCVDKALMVSFRNRFTKSGHQDNNWFYMNDGQPF